MNCNYVRTGIIGGNYTHTHTGYSISMPAGKKTQSLHYFKSQVLMCQ